MKGRTMARVTFTKRFDYRPRPDTWITYEAGETYDNVRREAAEQAIAEGRAIEDKTTRRRPARTPRSAK